MVAIIQIQFLTVTLIKKAILSDKGWNTRPEIKEAKLTFEGAEDIPDTDGKLGTRLWGGSATHGQWGICPNPGHSALLAATRRDCWRSKRASPCCSAPSRRTLPNHRRHVDVKLLGDSLDVGFKGRNTTCLETRITRPLLWTPDLKVHVILKILYRNGMRLNHA